MWFSESVHSKIALAGAIVNFMPSWWYGHYGIEYGERMVFDPDYRVDAYLQMRRTMHQRYAALGLGSSDPQPCVIAPDWQNAQGPATAGACIQYPVDNYPVSHHPSAVQLAALHVPADITKAWPFCESIRQVRYLADKLGVEARPVLNARGVLNEALLLRGEQVLGDLYSDPPAARRLLDYAQGVIHALVRHNHSVDPTCGHTLFNCAEIMVSPRTYEHALLDYDLATSRLCGSLGHPLSIHHCGRFDEYAPLYRRLGPLALIEVGSESSVRAALELFPEADIQYIVPTALLCRATRQDVGEHIDALLDETRGYWRRLRLNIPDLEYGMPDENLFELVEHLARAA